MTDSRRTERREVRSSDPSLSPEANRILTEELRQATGKETAEVPAGRPHAERERHAGRSSLAVVLADNRILLGGMLLAGIVFGLVLALTTGTWWLLPLAVVLDLVGMLGVAVIVLKLTTEVEHVDPSAAVELEQEGVSDPDRVFTELVEEFAEERPAGDDAASAAEQRDQGTPSRRSRPVGP